MGHRVWVPGLLCAACAASSVAAQRSEPYTVVAWPASGSVRLDGRLDEPAWQGAVRISNFTQRELDFGSPVSERTEVAVLFDRDALYVGFWGWDSDAEGIRADLSSTREPAVVVGGGLVSVKTLEAMIARKRKAHLVISSNRILSQMLDQTASDLLLAAFQRHGLPVHFNTDVKDFQGREHLESVQLSDGTTLACRIAIIGKGVVPNTSPLKDTGVALHEGVIVDSHMATNIPSIYAAGDVAEGLDLLRGKPQGNAIWPLAMEGGRNAGSNMAGVPTPLSGGLRMNVVEVLGVRVVSVGEWEGEKEIQSCRREIYRKLAFSERKLKGFILAGDIGCAGILTSLVKNQTNIDPADLEEGLDRGFSYRPRLRVLSGTVQSLEIGRRPI